MRLLGNRLIRLLGPSIGVAMHYRRAIVVAIHLVLIALSSYSAMQLRFDGNVPAINFSDWQLALPALIVIRILVFWPFRLHEGLWRYAGLWDLRNIIVAVVASSALFYVFNHGVLGLTAFPRSVLIIDSVLLVCMVGGTRLLRRVYEELHATSKGRRVIIYGAGDAGELIVRDMKKGLIKNYAPIGFIDDDPLKLGRRIHGIPVLGSRRDIHAIVQTFQPEEFLIAIPTAKPKPVREIVRLLEAYKIPLKTLPNLRDIIDGRVKVSVIRDLALEDLLSREPIGLDPAPVKQLVRNRRVLVTGAGGSIGSELCRQIVAMSPASLVLLDRYENTLYRLEEELRDGGYGRIVTSAIADVTDERRVAAIMREHRPELVFHAAAHKHVPLMEDCPSEAVKNNVRGTRVLAQAADRQGVDRFILISTDKAVNPTSVMGATKRVAELVIQALSNGSGTSFYTVRFGNVLASNGSVVPRFVEQIRKGGPVTVTHPEMRRFFMLIPEAVQLVLHAAAQPESSATYILEMGEQVKIVDMASDLIRLSGFVPDEDIAIEFTGLRLGEKLYEELVGVGEQAVPSSVEKIYRVKDASGASAVSLSIIAALEQTAAEGDDAAVLSKLRAILPEFTNGMDSSAVPLPVPVSPRALAAAGPAIGHQEVEIRRQCPKCAAAEVHRSRTKTWVDRLRRQLTEQRPYRCEECGWRGWLVPLFRTSEAIDEALMPDLDALDSVIAESTSRRPRGNFSPRNLA